MKDEGLKPSFMQLSLRFFTRTGHWFSLFLLAIVLPAHAQKTDFLPGLVATATDGQRQVTYVVPTANFTLTSPQSVHPQLKPQFKAEWNGLISLLRGGKYTFSGDAKIFVDGQEAQGKSLQLPAGEHEFKVAYERSAGGIARLQVQWESDFFKKEPIPAKVLGHRQTPPAAVMAAKIAHGRELIEERNCVACHQPENYLLTSRKGPDLTRVGNRANANWIFHWLENPKHFRAQALMPALPTSEQDRADIAAYLGSLRRLNLPPSAHEADASMIGKGKDLFDKIGCQACHGEGGFSLAGLGSKYTAEALANYLISPLVNDPSGRMPHLMISEIDATALAAYLIQSRNPDFEKPAPAGDKARGHDLVASSGCANCHNLTEEISKMVGTLTALPFKQLTGGKGCLAETPSPKAARYQFTAEEREAIGAYLASPDLSEAPVQDFHRLVTKFNCVGCHELNGPAKLTFELNQSPPSLTDAGNKLRGSWLTQVLNNQKRVRPWMALRMPHFGPLNVTVLINDFAAQAGAELGEGTSIAAVSAEEVQKAGKIVGQGEGGLSCINCHDFRGEKSGGEMRGPDMTEMYARIRADWIERWLRDPGRIQPGTAMPAYFTDMPEAQAAKMIHQIVTALSAGKNMPIPEGLSESASQYLMLVKNEPITFRTFIGDSSPRSIAVGLPGGQNYVFDAQLCRFRYAWSGDFLDVKPVWANRGGAPANILGTKYFTAADTYPIRFGDAGKEPVVKFHGYKLIQKIPEFMYEVDGVMVHERVTRATTGNGLVRSFTLGPVTKDIWFIAGEAKGVGLTSSVGAFQDGRLKIAPGKAVQFDVTILAQ